MTYTGNYRREPSPSRRPADSHAKSIHPGRFRQKDDKCRFTLALDPELNETLNDDRRKMRLSKTTYFKKFLDFIRAAKPVFFGGSILSELTAYAQLSDSISKLRIPKLAADSRRSTLQQVLFLLDKGLQQVEKERIDDTRHQA